MLRSGVLLLLCLAMLGGQSGVPEHGALLVANKGDHALGIVDPVSGRQVAVIPEGGVTGHEVTASPDGAKAYVPIYGDSGVGKPGTDGRTMVVMDLVTRKVTGTVDFGKGVRPHCPVFGPKDGMLYVTTELEKSITVIDPKTLKIVGSVPTGQAESHMLVLSHSGTRGYTANVGPGTVSVIDMQNRKVLSIIPISSNTQRIAISNDDKWVFTSDQTQPRLAIIDTATSQIAAWVPLPGPGYGTASTRDGRWQIVAVPTANKVAVVDLQTRKVAHVIDVPSAPQEVVVRPDNKVAYVSCDKSGKVAVIDIARWNVQSVIDAGKQADGLAWAPAS